MNRLLCISPFIRIHKLLHRHSRARPDLNRKELNEYQEYIDCEAIYDSSPRYSSATQEVAGDPRVTALQLVWKVKQGIIDIKDH